MQQPQVVEQGESQPRYVQPIQNVQPQAVEQPQQYSQPQVVAEPQYQSQPVVEPQKTAEPISQTQYQPQGVQPQTIQQLQSVQPQQSEQPKPVEQPTQNVQPQYIQPQQQVETQPVQYAETQPQYVQQQPVVEPTQSGQPQYQPQGVVESQQSGQPQVVEQPQQYSQQQAVEQVQNPQTNNAEQKSERNVEVRYYAPNVSRTETPSANTEVVKLGVEEYAENNAEDYDSFDVGFVDENVEDTDTTYSVNAFVKPTAEVKEDNRSDELKELEERLYKRIMNTLAGMNITPAEGRELVVNATRGVELPEEEVKLDLSEFKGKVELFIPLETIPQATWEDVVRRKGHHTYHVTCAKEGGYFIKKAKTPNPYAYVELKDEALEVAKCYAKREKAELKIHDAKGVIEQSMSFGKEKKKSAKKS